MTSPRTSGSHLARRREHADVDSEIATDQSTPEHEDHTAFLPLNGHAPDSFAVGKVVDGSSGPERRRKGDRAVKQRHSHEPNDEFLDRMDIETMETGGGHDRNTSHRAHIPRARSCSPYGQKAKVIIGNGTSVNSHGSHTGDVSNLSRSSVGADRDGRGACTGRTRDKGIGTSMALPGHPSGQPPGGLGRGGAQGRAQGRCASSTNPAVTALEASASRAPTAGESPLDPEPPAGDDVVPLGKAWSNVDWQVHRFHPMTDRDPNQTLVGVVTWEHLHEVVLCMRARAEGIPHKATDSYVAAALVAGSTEQPASQDLSHDPPLESQGAGPSIQGTPTSHSMHGKRKHDDVLDGPEGPEQWNGFLAFATEGRKSRLDSSEQGRQLGQLGPAPKAAQRAYPVYPVRPFLPVKPVQVQSVTQPPASSRHQSIDPWTSRHSLRQPVPTKIPGDGEDWQNEGRDVKQRVLRKGRKEKEKYKSQFSNQGPIKYVCSDQHSADGRTRWLVELDNGDQETVDEEEVKEARRKYMIHRAKNERPRKPQSSTHKLAQQTVRKMKSQKGASGGYI